MPNNKSGLRTAWNIFIFSDWRLGILLGAVALLTVGLIPIVSTATYYTFRYAGMRMLFPTPGFMVAVYVSTGYFILVNLRTRKAAWLIPLSILMLIYFVTTQAVNSTAGTFSPFTTILGGLIVVIMLSSYFRGGGFKVNQDLPSRVITEDEELALNMLGKAEHIVKTSEIDRQSDC